MTPQELLNSAGVFMLNYAPGRYYTTCPRCSATRQQHHQKLKCLGITITPDKVFGGCNHCGWTFPEKGAASGNGPLHYDYGADLRKVRRSSGGFFWQSLNGEATWESGTRGADTSSLLYRIDEVREAIASGEVVLVVEGEKDADTCWRLGFAATCNAHGASEPGKAAKWTAAHSAQLRGADVVVMGDNDAPGRAHVEAVCRASFGVARSVRVIDLADEWMEIGEGDDVSDWVARGGGTAKHLEELIGEARHYDPAQPGQAGVSTITPTPFVWDSIAWDGVEVPAQEWTVTDLIPAREVCLFSGYGGGGKSTIGLHLAAAHAVGRDWIGNLPELGGAFFIDAEDHLDVIHRRMAAICRFFDCSFQDLIDGGLKVLSLHGKDAVMATADRGGVVKPTPLYEQILQQAGDLKPSQIVIAPLSHVYSGSEIDRPQVTQFVALMAKIAIASGGSVVLISHPSVQGMANASGISGSTGWHNTVRARMYLENLKNGDGADVQPEHELRVLRFLKNQYGPPAHEITLRYQNGLFLPEPKLATYEIAAREMRVDEVFRSVLHRLTGSGRNLSDKSAAHNYAPRIIALEEEAIEAKVGKTDLEGAMRRLFKAGRIRIVPYGKPANGFTRIEEGS